MGHSETPHSNRTVSQQLFVHGHRAHTSSFRDRSQNIATHSWIHKEHQKAPGRSQDTSHRPNDTRRDERYHSHSIFPHQHNHTPGMEKSGQGERYIRAAERRGLDRLSPTHTYRHPKGSSQHGNSIRQSEMGGDDRIPPTAHRERVFPSSSPFSFLFPPHITPTRETTPFRRDSHFACNKRDPEVKQESIEQEHQAWDIAALDSERFHHTGMHSALFTSITGRFHEVCPTSRQCNTLYSNKNSRYALNHVSFQKLGEMRVFWTKEPVSALLHPRTLHGSRITFSTRCHVVNFYESDPPISLFFPGSPPLQAQRETHTSTLPIVKRETNTPNTKRRETETHTIQTNHTTLFPPHPPKIPRFLVDALRYMNYDLFDHSPIYTPLTFESTTHSRNLCCAPLKKVCSSTLNLPALIERAHTLNIPKAVLFEELISVLQDVDKFKKLFLLLPKEYVTGKASSLTNKDLMDLRSWGLVEALSRKERPVCSSTAFKVLKSDGQTTRLILDCRDINKNMKEPPPFSLPSPFLIIVRILSFSFASTADFCSWFFQHGVHSSIAKFFAFRVGGKWVYLCRLAQGWKFSPVIAQTSSEILAFDENDPSKESSLVWIDNICIGADSHDRAREKRERFISRCESVGAEIGEISEVTQSLEYVGGEFDLREKRWRLKTNWIEKVVPILREFPERASSRRVWCAVGLILWFLRMSLRPLTLADPLIFFLSRLAKRITLGEIDWLERVTVWPTVRENLVSFIPLIEKNSWRKLSYPLPCPSEKGPILFSDASLWGGAGVWRGEILWSAKWEEELTHRDILALEALAWERSVRAVVQQGCRHFASVVDNQPLYFSLLKTRSKSFAVNVILNRTFLFLSSNHCCIFAGWVPTDLMPADKASRGLTEKPKIPPLTQIRLSDYPFICAYDE